MKPAPHFADDPVANLRALDDGFTTQEARTLLTSPGRPQPSVEKTVRMLEAVGFEPLREPYTSTARWYRPRPDAFPRIAFGSLDPKPRAWRESAAMAAATLASIAALLAAVWLLGGAR